LVWNDDEQEPEEEDAESAFRVLLNRFEAFVLGRQRCLHCAAWLQLRSTEQFSARGRSALALANMVCGRLTLRLKTTTPSHSDSFERAGACVCSAVVPLSRPQAPLHESSLGSSQSKSKGSDEKGWSGMYWLAPFASVGVILNVGLQAPIDESWFVNTDRHQGNSSRQDLASFAQIFRCSSVA